MRRVVVTGLGIVSCLGNDQHQVLDALKSGRSGIRFKEEYAERGFRSQVAGTVDIDLDALVDRKQRRFMGDAAAYAYVSMAQAIEDAGLTPEQVSNDRTGLIAGSGGASSANQVEAADVLREKGLRRVGPYRVTRTMGSTVSACLATPFQIKGINYSISSACATSAHCIGNAVEQIQLGKQDVVFAGGGEEEHWTLSCLFDAMGALSTGYNDTPEKASRPYDKARDGFVIADGGGMLVLEELEHARSRGAHIHGDPVFGLTDVAGGRKRAIHTGGDGAQVGHRQIKAERHIRTGCQTFDHGAAAVGAGRGDIHGNAILLLADGALRGKRPVDAGGQRADIRQGQVQPGRNKMQVVGGQRAVGSVKHVRELLARVELHQPNVL